MAVKKIELIEWLARLQDESLIHQIEALKKNAIKDRYEQRIPKSIQDIHEKLNRSEQDILAGKTLSQDEVESIFKAKFGK